jgi:hypothetical protein
MSTHTIVGGPCSEAALLIIERLPVAVRDGLAAMGPDDAAAIREILAEHPDATTMVAACVIRMLRAGR